MYNRSTRTSAQILDRLRPGWVERHRGHYTEFLERHECQAQLVAKAGRPGLSQVAPYLFRRATDERALRCGLDYLASRGGQAPGPDGMVYEDLATERHKWQFCRALRDDLRSWEYRPGPERIVKIAKGAGRGERSIAIQSIEDRVVQRSVLSIIQPLLDPYFQDNSFGYRPGPGRTRLHALALAEQYLIEEKRTVWLTQDISDAFGSVPIRRLLQLVRKYLLDEDITRLVERILDGSSSPGLRQGGCLSPILLNLYLHHLLDRPWRKRHPDLPMIRVADDLLVLCKSAKEARRAHDSLEEVLTPAGMSLREPREEAIRRLSKEEPALWLGFVIDKCKGKVRYRIADRAWERLDDALRLAHEHLSPSKHARQIAEGWLVQMAPCLPWESAPKAGAIERVKELAKRHGFGKALRLGRLRELWSEAHSFWEKLRGGEEEPNG